ncbi:MAG: hypothetical protein GKR94_17390 [Gammaproteobacteria bacterium]|nr:hypothetical protein [Gammaproteobacteria bacterium]
MTTGPSPPFGERASTQAFTQLSRHEILLLVRLYIAAPMNIRASAQAIDASPSTIGDSIRRAQVAQLSEPLPEGMGERGVQARPFSCVARHRDTTSRPLPGRSPRTQRQKREAPAAVAGVQERAPGGLPYGHFCEHYRRWVKGVDGGMRQSHPSPHTRANAERLTLLNRPALETLQALELTAMATALAGQMNAPRRAALFFEKRLGLLVDRAATGDRHNRSRQPPSSTRLRRAMRCHDACVEDIGYRRKRALDNSLIHALSTHQWMAQHHHWLVTGATARASPGGRPAALVRQAGREGQCAMRTTKANTLRADHLQASSISRLDGENRTVMTRSPKCSAWPEYTIEARCTRTESS